MDDLLVRTHRTKCSDILNGKLARKLLIQMSAKHDNVKSAASGDACRAHHPIIIRTMREL